MSSYRNVALLQNLTSMICHDLSDIAVTIDNCVGLLDNGEYEIQVKAKDIIGFESDNFINKIRFYRSVYGVVAGEEKIDVSYFNEMLTNYINKKKIILTLDVKKDLIAINTFLARAGLVLFTLMVDIINPAGKIFITLEENIDDGRSYFSIIGYSNTKFVDLSSIKHPIPTVKEEMTIYNCKKFFLKEMIDNFLRGYKIIVDLVDEKTIRYIIK